MQSCVHSREISWSHKLENRQCNSTDLPSENGRGYPQQRPSGHSKRTLGLFDTQSLLIDYLLFPIDHSRISTKCFELSSRLGVQKLPLRLEIRPQFFFADFESSRSSSDRSFCVALEPPTAKLHALATRSGELCSRLEKPLRCISSILSDSKNICKGKEKDNSFIHHNTTKANTTVVRGIVVNVGDIFNFVTQT